MFLWLAIKNKYWTADQLEKRGLSHPEQCVLCDQEDETAQHILVGCAFAWEFWFHLFAVFNLQQLVPQRNERDSASWWRRASKRVAKEHHKGVNTLIILGAWTIWKHQNVSVFDKASQNVQTALSNLKLKVQLWSFAGVRGLSELGLGRLLS
jgi:hypothetical protein